MDLARDQNLEGVTSSKISGVCGKLMCCLNYELYLYKLLKKDLPKIGDKIKTTKGVGTVINLNVLGGKALVELEDGTKEEIIYKEEGKSA
jgi:cell fate regulator YaaT (PSP1 superfamily)